jgi:aspartyl protease family protein
MSPIHGARAPHALRASRRHGVSAAFVLSTLLPAFCSATEVHVIAVTPGQSASVVIDGGAPVSMGVGESVEAVTLLNTDSDGATLRVNGVVVTLPLEAQHGFAGGYSAAKTVKLKADARGHFITNGMINRKSVRFLVDTGASATTLSRKEARRIGLSYSNGASVRTMTANGSVNGWRVELDTVRVGNVTVHDVEAVVIDTDLPVVLLGMTFLDRFEMERTGSTLVLQRRR